MSTPLRDLIPIPEQTGAEDYVLRLTESVENERVDDTIAHYVVTDGIARAFDQALGLVSEAISSGESRAASCRGRSARARATSWPCCTPCSAGVPPRGTSPRCNP